MNMQSEHGALLLRRALYGFVLTVGLALGLAVLAAPTPSRVALVIGNGTYAHTAQLRNPVHDAHAIAAALSSLGYSVQLVTDAGKPAMEAALDRFAAAAAGADQAVLFFSGHGVEVNGVNYLLPVDAQLASETTISLKAIPLSTAMSVAGNARQLGLVVLDACRNNPLVYGNDKGSRGLAGVQPQGGKLLVAFATRDGHTADDGSGGNSPYTAAILDALKKPGLEVDLFFRTVHDSVVSATGGAQEPYTYGSLRATALYLNPPATTPAPPAYDPRAAEMLLYQGAQTMGTAEAYRDYLQHYPNGQYARQAQLAISKLTAAATPAPGRSAGPATAARIEVPQQDTPALPPPPGPLALTDAQRGTARKVGRILEEEHYSHLAIDDKMSEQIYQRYLEFLDGQHSYFLASDIAEFSAYKLKFGDMIRTGDMEPGYVMLNRYRQRNRERVEYALSLLNVQPDWTLNESFEFDRAKAPWPAGVAEINELWRKRVKQDALSLMLAGKTWPEAVDTLRKRYTQVLKRVDQLSPEDAFEGLMNAYARSFDPHSAYFSPRNSEDYRIQMSLNYEGIGATLQQDDDYVKIVSIVEGGPAAVAGTLNINDRIVGVGEGKSGAVTEVVGWRVDDVVQLIRGKAATTVRLAILPAGAAPGSPEKILELVRGKVTLEDQAARQEVKSVTRNGRTLKVGVITVPGFYRDTQAQDAGDQNYRSTTRDVRKRLSELKTAHIEGLVLDLRADGGGVLQEATALTGLFIKHGPVVQVRDTTGRLETLDDPEPAPVYDGPLAVLVDRYAASASEIFAGAIQDYHRGLILGQRTFGKGTVQNVVPLDRWSTTPSSGQLTVTIGKFYRVTGESTQHRGVEPDIELPSPIDMKEVGESSLEAALPWDRIAGVPFSLASGTAAAPPVAPLVSEEGLRAQRDPDYHWLVADIAALDELRAHKTMSLNLQVRRAERDAEQAGELARENSRRTALGLPALHSPEDLESVCPAPAANARPPATCKDFRPDVMLDQAAEIVGDMVKAPAAPAPAGHH